MRLDQLSVHDFTLELASGNPTPGGGSAAALCGALGAALATMVARVTEGKEKFREAWNRMETAKRTASHLMGHFLHLVQKDTEAYQGVVSALRLPRETQGQKASRQDAVQEAMKKAATVPLETLRASEELLRMVEDVVKRGNPNALTDAGAAVHLARGAAMVAAYNVRVNLASIQDRPFVAKTRQEVEEKLERMNALYKELDGYVDGHLP